ncbi:uncharacterized protein ACMZJ9_004096 [Mantella aurantiaca]
MRKNSIVICCAIFCLLSAVPGNQGAKLLESLSCIASYPTTPKIFLTCTWLENNISAKLVNMTLKEKDNDQNVCQNKSMINSSLTHSTWTCDIFVSATTETNDINFIFVPERNLETQLNTTEERDEAKPQNLRCNDIDGNFTCSWQVRKEIAESIDFDLFYGHDEKECQPKCQQEISEYLSCHCSITTDGHLNISALLKTIGVKPRNPKNSLRSFRLCLIYQLPPRNLSVDEIEKGKFFRATWRNDIQEKADFKYEYELCLWNQGDLKLKEVPEVCPSKPDEMDKSHDYSATYKLGVQLEPSSNYSLMVRVRLKEDEFEDGCYQGPWSRWSNVQTLITKSVPNLIVLYFLIPICVIVIVMFGVCGYRALVRYTKKWDERIPNPNKSAIVKGFQKTKTSIVNEPCLPYKEHLYIESYNNISMGTSSSSKESPHFYYNEEHTSKLDREEILDEDTECVVLCDLTKEDYPTASIVDGYKPFTDSTEEQESKDIENSQFTFSAFDGPYLFSESNSS